MSFIYLACPYSHPDAVIRERRAVAAGSYAALLAKHRVPCYCPVASWHYVSVQNALPGDAETWWMQDKAFLDRCGAFWFVQGEGWNTSTGMHKELLYMQKSRRGIPRLRLEPGQVELAALSEARRR